MKNILKYISIALLALFSGTLRAEFVHPGAPFSIDDLDRMKANRTVEPWATGYNLMTSHASASLNYTMRGPFELVGRETNVNLSEFESDGNAVLYQAIQWYITGDSTYATNAISILDAWATTHKSWSGGTPFLAATDGGLTYVMGAEILRHTYDGWTEQNTINAESYFLEMFWPLYNIPDPIRAANQGAAQIKGSIAVAVFCDDQEKFDQVLDAFLYDACGGLPNTLANGQTGDSGRDVGHSLGVIKNLSYASEVAWTQGIDLYGALDDRLLAVHEYFCQYNLLKEVPWIEFGTCYGYFTEIGSNGRGIQSSSADTNELIYGAYVVRNGLSAPNVAEYRDDVPVNIHTFLFRKDDTGTQGVKTEPVDYVEQATSVVSTLTSVDVGEVGVAGNSVFADGVWTVQGAGSDLYAGNDEDSFHFAYQELVGDGAIIARVDAVENTDSNAKAGVVIRESLAPDARTFAVTTSPGTTGTSVSSRGLISADRNGFQSFSTAVEPIWVKIERVGNRIAGYVGPDGVNWTPIQNTEFEMSEQSYVGLGVSSKNTSVLNTSTFSNVEITESESGSDPKTIATYGVAVTPSVLSIIIGEDSGLVATVKPSDATNKNVSYSSSDTSIATVDSNGLVSGVGEGKVVITVASEDGGASVETNITVSSVDDRNLALGKTVTQSSTGFGAGPERAVDGNTSGVFGDGSVTHTTAETNAWWQVDLGEVTEVGAVNIFGRTDCCSDRLSDFIVSVLDSEGEEVDSLVVIDFPNPSTSVNFDGIEGQFVRIQLQASVALSLAEVEIFGNIEADFDGDGISDAEDPDDDNDGVDDVDDAFPFDSTESMDTDEDGIGDNSEIAGQFINISTRGYVANGDGILIGGIVIDGTEPLLLLIQGVGSELVGEPYNIAGDSLLDTEISIYEGDVEIVSNDDWDSDSVLGSEITDAGLVTGATVLESGSLSSAILMELDPGIYTVLLNGKNGATGVGLVEVYNVSTKIDAD